MERELRASGFETVCGIDEAGRGPLAGPVFAAAVILPAGLALSGLDDSKKLSAKTRERLYGEIVERALAYGIASASHKEIDEVNILNATFLAMNRAFDALGTKPNIALVDGNRDPGIRCRAKCVVGGDGKSASIAAASILAKVARDRHMMDMAERYPQYGFEKHKGYGTKLHYEKLGEYGPSEIHRLSFLKKWMAGAEAGKGGGAPTEGRPPERGGGPGKSTEDPRASARRRGKWGEGLALEYLKGKGYARVAEGFRTRFGEIDLIVENSEYLVFAEVKLRKSSAFAYAREFVGREKQRKITATANLWLASHKTRLQPRFDVIEVYAPDGEGTASPEIVHIENAF